VGTFLRHGVDISAV